MSTDFDAVVVGAGFGGLYMLQNLRQLDMSVKVFERGGGVGGTWYWNRYPGARCDSESVYYMFSDHFSSQILDEWTWSERFAGQPEILEYLNFVTDKMDLRPGHPVQHGGHRRRLRRGEQPLGDHHRRRRHHNGALPHHGGRLHLHHEPARLPRPRGLHGEKFHTGAWPHEPVDFTGKRVAVIGTGATGVQAIPEIAKQASQLYVFQRTPNYDIPARNARSKPTTCRT